MKAAGCDTWQNLRRSPDETTGRDEKPVQLGRKNFSLLLDTEAQEGILGLPVAVDHAGRNGSFYLRS